MQKLLAKLRTDFAELEFRPSKTFYWSPKEQVIHYRENAVDDASNWSLLHELSHALLKHKNYTTDFELLQMEVAAWAKAEEIAKHYQQTIDPDHVQDCIDTYRDWLYQRSTCPTCTACSLQSDHRTYNCLNCGTTWHVSASRLCRPYRRKQKEAQTVV